MTRSLFFLVAFSLMLMSVSCSDRDTPKDLIDEDRYIKIFSQLVMVNQIMDDQLGEISRDYLVDQVFEQHNVTDDQFYRSHQYYQRQPGRQLERINRMEEKFKNERDQFQERLNQERQAKRDSSVVTDTL